VNYKPSEPTVFRQKVHVTVQELTVLLAGDTEFPVRSFLWVFYDAKADPFTADVELFSTRLLDCVLGTGVLFVGTSNYLNTSIYKMLVLLTFCTTFQCTLSHIANVNVFYSLGCYGGL